MDLNQKTFKFCELFKVADIYNNHVVKKVYWLIVNNLLEQKWQKIELYNTLSSTSTKIGKSIIGLWSFVIILGSLYILESNCLISKYLRNTIRNVNFKNLYN